MIELRVLGTLHIERNGSVATRVVAQPKLSALLTYLVLARPRGPHRRDTLLALLWPDLDESRARHALNQALYSLRRSLGGQVVPTHGTGEVGVDTARITCDLLVCEEAVGQERLRAAAQLYVGDLLPGFHAGAAVEFDYWLDGERMRARRLATEVGGKLIELCESTGDIDGALRWARWTHERSPEDETGLRRLIEMADRLGDRVAAVTAYETFAERASTEYGVDPAPETQELISAIRQRTQSRPEGNPPRARPAPSLPASAHVPTSISTIEPAAAPHGKARAGAVALTIAGLLGMAVLSRGDRPTTVGETFVEPTRLILAEFENHTSDSLLGILVTEALRIDLGQSHAVRVVDPSRVAVVVKTMGHTGGESLGPGLAREVALREGAAAVLAGSVYATGSSYVLSARLVASDGDSVVVALRETALDSSHLIAAIDRLSGALREGIGESLTTVRTSPPLERVTTPSLPALRLFTAAVQAGWLGGSDQDLAIRLLEQALVLDPGFAMAHRALAIALADRGLDAFRSGALRARAFELRHRLPELERHLTEGSYWIWVGDRDAQVAAWNRVLELRPDDFRALDYLGAVHLSWGDLDRAEELFRRSYDDRRTHVALGHLVQVQVARGQIDAARDALTRLQREYPDHPGVVEHGAAVDYAAGDYTSAIDRWRSLNDASPGWRAGAALERAGINALLGRLREADADFDRGMVIYEDEQRAWNRIANAAWRATLAAHVQADTAAGLERLARLIDQYPPDSLDALTRALSGLSMVHVALVEAAAAYAFLGRPERATELVTRMEEALPPSRRRWAEGDRLTALGAIALARDDAREASRLLGEAMTERSWPPTALILEGRIHERQGQPSAAAASYERFLATPVAPDGHRICCHLFGQVGSDALWRPWVHRHLGDLYEQTGDHTRALAHYRAFVDLRKDADPELQPEVDQVRRRIGRLTPTAQGVGTVPPHLARSLPGDALEVCEVDPEHHQLAVGVDGQVRP